MSSPNSNDSNYRKIILSLSAIFGTLFPLSHWFKEKLWSLHDLWFLEPEQLVMVVFGALFSSVVVVFIHQRQSAFLSKPFRFWIIASLIVIGFIYMVCSYPIVFDDFGNAFQYREFAERITPQVPPYLLSQLLSFQIEPSVGRKTVLNFYDFASFSLQTNYGDVFKWSGLISALVYCLSMLVLISQLVKDNLIKVVAALFSLAAPLTMVFYHHFEIYAPVYASIALWLVLFIQFDRTRRVSWLIAMIVLGLFCYKLHPLSLVLTVGVLLSALLTSETLRDKLTWKNVFLFLHLPLMVVGIVVYFFVVKDYNDPRFLDGVTDSERLFLPIISPPAPLHNYNLFSFNHIFDYFNAALLWSIPALLVLIFGTLSTCQELIWNRPSVLLPLNLGLMVAAVLFAINPLLSMPMDRDLFMFPSVFFLVGTFGILGQLDSNHIKWLMPALCFFSVLQLPRFVVNSDAQLLSLKLEETGKNVFKTYHLHSSRILINSLNLKGNVNDYLAGKERILKELKPYAIEGNDPKYANLLMDDGYYYLKYGGDVQRAILKLKEALLYNPKSQEIRALLQEANTQIKR